MAGVTETDPDFGKKLQEILTNGFKMNGDLNGTSELHSPIEEEEKQEVEAENSEDVEQSGETAEEKEEVAVNQDSNIPVEIAAAS